MCPFFYISIPYLGISSTITFKHVLQAIYKDIPCFTEYNIICTISKKKWKKKIWRLPCSPLLKSPFLWSGPAYLFCLVSCFFLFSFYLAKWAPCMPCTLLSPLFVLILWPAVLFPQPLSSSSFRWILTLFYDLTRILHLSDDTFELLYYSFPMVIISTCSDFRHDPLATAIWSSLSNDSDILMFSIWWNCLI